MINGQYKKIDAIISLVGHVATGTEEKGYTYKEGITPPTEEAIETERLRLQAEYDALAWKRNRQAEYPTIEELVVALYDTDDKSAIEAKRAEVKNKFPKT